MRFKKFSDLLSFQTSCCKPHGPEMLVIISGAWMLAHIRMSVPFEWDDGTYVAESESELQVCHLSILLLGSLSTRKGGLTGMM